MMLHRNLHAMTTVDSRVVIEAGGNNSVDVDVLGFVAAIQLALLTIQPQ